MRLRISSRYKIKIDPGTKCLYCDSISRHLALCQKHYNRWYQGVQMEDPKKTITVDREALAWAAGFFDGEGTTGVQKIGSRWKGLRLSIRQIHKDTLERFQTVVGFGKVTGPEKAPSLNNGTRQPIYTWRCQKFEDVQQVICLLWPWLTPHKKEQAKQSFKSYIENGNHRSVR